MATEAAYSADNGDPIVNFNIAYPGNFKSKTWRRVKKGADYLIKAIYILHQYILAFDSSCHKDKYVLYS